MIDFLQNMSLPSFIYLIISLFGLIDMPHNYTTVGYIIYIIIVLFIVYLLDYIFKTYGQPMAFISLFILYVIPIFFKNYNCHFNNICD